ncbi:phage head closure protein [Streptococcus agalactiae]|uniref:phage head closure protein n=1 Tax=Streptococcus agalactiae TaxID=1311 RepID=UPI001374CFB4|nr:phage head closure protein [Streptococcus agalactiae]KAF1103411.1 phage head-tail joining protein [Streptococcus agalactiae]HEM9550004.1 phage head closure protein [Streptococcus agalactiae]HEM9551772.1 phage head closure protein [Streptococcus agalactiae]HEM9553966.1 phage head closure protein [Streptococcus agalactiae]HEM9567894.1 phage head closure protein [Streptococcus agalactiae]
MITRKMNVRITIFNQTGGQNEDGEVVDNIREDLYTCWAEVSKTQLRDFNYQSKYQNASNLPTNKDTKVFLIRYNPKLSIDNTMFIEHNKRIYKIDKIEFDESGKEMIMLSGVSIS